MNQDKIKLLIATSFDKEQRERLEKEFSDIYDIAYANGIEDSSYDAEVIIGEPDIDKLVKFHNLRLVQMTWAGTDKYTRHPGFPENVILTNATGAFGVIISEYVIGSILSVYRHLDKYYENQKNCQWKDEGAEMSLHNKEVLILGAGNIGSETAKRLKAFGCITTGIKKKVEAVEGFDYVYGMEEIDKCLSKADVIICCLPNTDETIGLLNKDKLLMTKKNATLVNVGRGALIVEKDLIEVLECGHFAHVIMDVFENEPLSKNSPLWNMERVHITPHISGPSFGHCKDTSNFILNICADNLKRYYNKDILCNIVDLEKGYAK